MGHKYRCSIIFSIKAEKEILKSWKWYEEIQQALGDRFVKEVTHQIQKIAESPFQYSRKIKEFREVALSVFPFLIVYRMNSQENIARIISVFHTSRNPYKKFKA
jgi:plasmid stabilization system protein ParE